MNLQCDLSHELDKLKIKTEEERKKLENIFLHNIPLEENITLPHQVEERSKEKFENDLLYYDNLLTAKNKELFHNSQEQAEQRNLFLNFQMSINRI